MNNKYIGTIFKKQKKTVTKLIKIHVFIFEFFSWPQHYFFLFFIFNPILSYFDLNSLKKNLLQGFFAVS